MNFEIYSLLTRSENGVTGPMSPVIMAQNVCKQLDVRFNRLARVHFSENDTHQYLEGAAYTAHDNLIIGRIYKNDIWLSLWVDQGISAVPVAMILKSENIVMPSEIYKKQRYSKTLSIEEMGALFQTIFDNPSLMDVLN